MTNLLLPIVLLPLAGFFINGLAGNRLGKGFVSFVACGLPIVAFLIAVRATMQLLSGDAPLVQTVFTWAQFADRSFEIAFYFDRLTAVMTLIVTGVGSLIHVYSIGYMHEDKSYARYFAYLNLFLFFMLMLVLGRSLLVLFVGWEGVGLASYLLIGFWFEDPVKAAAGKKAFITNRVGDAGFLLGMFLLYRALGTLQMDQINAAFLAGPVAVSASLVGVCLFIGATGKSAQIPLHVWLPDAMEGPTPVSRADPRGDDGDGRRVPGRAAARHLPAYAGCVGAGGDHRRAPPRSSPRRSPSCRPTSRRCWRIRRSRSSASCSWRRASAPMASPCSTSTRTRSSRRCLFLGAGSVIHAMSGEQDIRKMGGLAKKIPVTFVTFAIATAAIAGLPPLAGFFSKDEILWFAFASERGGAPWLFALAAATALMTAFYMFRLLWLTFFGTPRMDEKTAHHIHESPWSMTGVLIVLAVLSTVGGFFSIPHFLEGTLPLPVGAAGTASLRKAAARAVGRHRTARARGRRVLLLAQRRTRGAGAQAHAAAAPSALRQVLHR